MNERAPDRIQPGIFFRRCERPAACWRLLLLDVEHGTSSASARTALQRIDELLAELARGSVRELEGQPDLDAEATRATFRDLAWLWGFGRRLFDEDEMVHSPPLTRADRPEFLAYLPKTGEPFPALPWAPGASSHESDLALQLTGANQAAVNRAAMEIWKLIRSEALPLSTVASFDGFLRPDGRGWLEFHDGVSNIESSQRLTAIEARGGPAWMAGGTYMAFLRFRVDLEEWMRLDRSAQELVVGRDKLSGSPLVAVERDAEGRPQPVAAPLPPEPSDAELADHHDPPQATDPVIEASHLHRANQNRSSPHAPAGWRMFRQGYDFLESVGPDGPVLGLNFVSFQADLAVLQHVLHLPGWLADVNFGGRPVPGPGEPASPMLLSVLAGGLYAVPPVADPFPGAELFS